MHLGKRQVVYIGPLKSVQSVMRKLMPMVKLNITVAMWNVYAGYEFLSFKWVDTISY